MNVIAQISCMDQFNRTYEEAAVNAQVCTNACFLAQEAAITVFNW